MSAVHPPTLDRNLFLETLGRMGGADRQPVTVDEVQPAAEAKLPPGQQKGNVPLEDAIEYLAKEPSYLMVSEDPAGKRTLTMTALGEELVRYNLTGTR